MRKKTKAARGRFILSNEDLTAEEVWDSLKAMFLEYERSEYWYPVMISLKPIINDSEGKPYEFEFVGSTGERHPVFIKNWEEEDQFLSYWKGPAKDPHWNRRERFFGSIYGFQILQGFSNVIVEISYKCTYKKPRLLGRLRRRKNNFRNPVYAIRWMMKGIPFPGKVDYVKAFPHSQVEEI